MEVAVIDLFAGAGGLSIGACMAGAPVALALEWDALACETMRLNAGYHVGQVLEADVCSWSGHDLRDRAMTTRSGPLVVVGGPPCQPFSKAAYWTDPGDDARYRQARALGTKAPKPAPILTAKPDNRRSLVEEYWRVVVESKADAFLFENVPSILHPRNRVVIEWLLAQAEESGYSVVLVKVNAAEFGVPQLRKRIVVLGSRHGTPSVPSPTHSGSDALDLRPFMAAGEALAPFAGEAYFEPEEVVEGRWAEHLRVIPPGGNYKHHTAWAGHPHPTFEAETRFWHFLLKLSPNKPSWTVAASPGPWTGPFHWDSRRLRTSELAALQGFPDDYRFAGSRRERVRQIGNAVPPLVAAHMVHSLLKTVDDDPPENLEARCPASLV